MCCLWNMRSDVVPCVYGLSTDLMDSCRAAIIPQHVQNKQRRKLNLLVWIRVSAEESYFTLITDIMWETFTTREMQDIMGTNTFSEQLLSAQTTCLWARYSTSDESSCSTQSKPSSSYEPFTGLSPDPSGISFHCSSWKQGCDLRPCGFHHHGITELAD